MLKFFLKLIILVLIIIFAVFYFVSRGQEEKQLFYGIVFSGTDQELYLAVLDDLIPKKIRIVASSDLENLDWQIQEAGKRGLEIILDLSIFDLENLEQIIKKYKNNAIIKYWQVKNKSQVYLIKAFDNRPVIVADTGELSFWWNKSRIADILGINIYSEPQNKYLKYINFNMPAWTYKLRAKIIRKPVIITELQLESVEFAKQTGITEAYIKGNIK